MDIDIISKQNYTESRKKREVFLLSTIYQRMRLVREKAGISQNRLSKALGIGQSCIYRYEAGQTEVPVSVAVKYADFFDVSLDYLCARSDNPSGGSYEQKVKVEKAYPEMDKFIEMCFDQSSEMSNRLKQTLKQMLLEGEADR